MATLFCWSAIILLVVCAFLHFTRRRALGCWLLVLLPAVVLIDTLIDLLQVRNFGPGASSYLKTLPFLLAQLAVTVLAAMRPRWRWLFWIAWLVSALLCSIAIYLTFFWKVFS